VEKWEYRNHQGRRRVAPPRFDLRRRPAQARGSARYLLASVLATVVSRAYFGNHPAFIVKPYRARVWRVCQFCHLNVKCQL